MPGHKRTPQEIIRAGEAVELLRYVRKLQGSKTLSYWDMGRDLGVSDNAVRCWVIGKNLPNPESTNHLLRVYADYAGDLKQLKKAQEKPAKPQSTSEPKHPDHHPVSFPKPDSGFCFSFSYPPDLPPEMENAANEEIYKLFFVTLTRLLRTLPLRRLLVIRQVMLATADHELQEHLTEAKQALEKGVK